MSWRLRVRHTTAYEYAGVVHASYNEARISPLDTPTQFTLEHRVEVHPAREPLPVPRLLGQPRPRVRHPSRAHRARRHRHVGSRDGRADAEPRHVRRVGRSRLAGSDRAVLRVPDTDDLHPARRRHRPARRGPAGRVRRRPTRFRALGTWLRDHIEYEPVRHERVDDGGPRSLRSGPRRLPGLRPPRARGVARRRHPRPVRERLPVPGGRRRRGRHATRGRATRGWRPGPATGTRSTRHPAPTSPNATCSSRADATTPTSRR